MKKSSLALLIAIATASFTAAAVTSAPSGNALAGEAKSAACAACHGKDGNSTSGEFPRLAGQNADYLYNALVQYKTGKRKNAIMPGFVATLKTEDLADLAAYFASQKGLEVKY